MPELANLLRADLFHRWQQGERTRVDIYFADFPALASDKEAALTLVMGEVLLRQEAGDPASLAELQQRFPALADDLPRRLSNLATLVSQWDHDTDGQAGPIPGPAHAPLFRPKSSWPHIPGYQIQGELGRGGMGVVYKAFQTDLKRLVAIKMILAGAQAGANELARFRIEAEAVARLKHVNIVQIHEIGVQGGQHYFSLEFVEGGSLQQKLKDKPMRPKLAAQLMETLARAMHCAHQQGIIHRDLKPANVLMTSDGVPKITDFGLAKRLDVPGQTRTGAVMGTPSYMSPEQAMGKQKEVGPATDIYALGAMLYEFLTGRPPFLAETPMDTLMQVIANDALPPSRLQPKLPRDLETICLKCLHKQPGKRYATAQGLADDLGHFLAGEPIMARPIGPWERGVKWVKRRPTRAAILALSALAAVALLTGGLWYHIQLKHAFLQTEHERDRVAKLNQNLTDQLVRLRIANGVEQVQDQDALPALAWFADAWKLNRSVRDREHRMRMAAVLAMCPKVEQIYFHDRRVNWAVFHPDQTRVITCCGDSRARIWDVASGKETVPALVHDGPVLFAMFSADGSRVATASIDGTARVWDTATGSRISTGYQHKKAVNWLALSADGTRVVSASSDGTAAVCDASTGQLIPPLLRHKAAIHTIEFGPHNKLLLTASSDNTAQLWAAADHRRLATFHHADRVNCAVFSPDGLHVATASDDATACIWSIRGRMSVAPLSHLAPVLDVTFAPDGKHVVTTSKDNTARIWSTGDGQPVSSPLRHGSHVYSARYSACGTRIVTAGDDNTARIWDATLGEQKDSPLRSVGTARFAMFSADANRVLIASADGTARIWKVTGNKIPGRTLPHGERVEHAAYSPGGGRIATATNSGKIQLWKARTAESLGPAIAHPHPVARLVFSTQGQRLAAACADGSVCIWDPDSGKRLLTFSMCSQPLTDLAFSADGAWIASAGSDGTAFIWDSRSGVLRGSPMKHQRRVNSVAFSPDQHWLVTASNDHTAQVWDAHTGAPQGPPLRHQGPVMEATFSPDSERIVTASADRTARIWSRATSKQLTPPLRHVEKVTHAVFGPRGKRVLTASDDNTARVWDAATGKAHTPPLEHSGSVITARFSPNGRWVVTASLDNTAVVWGANTGEPLTPPLPHKAGVMDASFSPNGKHVLTASSDRTARIWDLTVDKRPFQEILDETYLLSGARIDATGGFAPLNIKELQQVWIKTRAGQKPVSSPPVQPAPAAN